MSTVTTAPATVATAAAKGKARAAATAPATVTPAAITVEDLRAAVSAYDDAANVNEGAGVSLESAVLARYSFHAAKFAKAIEGGTVVLPDNEHKQVTVLVWLDATERAAAPAAKTYTPAQRSIANYLSRFGKVAVNGAYGIAALATVESAHDAKAAIDESVKSAKANETAAAAALADMAARDAYDAWIAALPIADTAALARVRDLLTGKGRTYAAAFIASIVDANGSTL